MLLFGCSQKEKAEKTEKEDWWLWTANWNPHGEQIVAGGTQDTLRIFSSTDYKLSKNYRIDGTITKSKWHPYNDKLAIAMQGGKSKSLIFDLEKDKRIELDSLDGFGARAIGWNNSGDLLAVGDYSGFLTIYNTEGEILKRIDLEQRGLIGLDWHPNKNLITIVGDRIALYDFDNDTTISIQPRNEEVLMLCVAWHPSGDFFVTGDYGDFEKNYPPLLQYWTSKGEKIKSIEKSKAEYRNLKWSNDGKLLATASDYVRLWTKEGKLMNEQKSENLLWGIDWNNDDSQIVTTDEVGRVIIWNRELEKVRELEY
jgi:WD40 repeat protein